jgi:hypothetical protein
MKFIDFPIERINLFFDTHTFVIQSPYYSDENIEVKVRLTGIRQMIVIGEKSDVIEYTLYIENTGKISGEILGEQFKKLGSNKITLTSYDAKFYQLITPVSSVLRNMLYHFNIQNSVMCNSVVNNLKKNINEGVINEGRYDNIVRKVVKDIMSVVKYQKEGEYVLPEDISDKMVYTSPKLYSPFSIELTLNTSEDVETVEVNGEYYPNEDIILIEIVSNPNLDREILEELHFELNELVRHEIEHMSQLDRGEEFPEYEPEDSLEYYTQKHELEAQLAGFIRRAQKERKPLEDVIRGWFIKNYSKHNLSPKDVEKVIKRILELS